MSEFRWTYHEKPNWYSISGELNFGIRRWQLFAGDVFFGRIEADGKALVVDGYDGCGVRLGFFSDLDEAKAALESWATQRQAMKGGEGND